jgi:dTDP-4-dehydrorhamnose 3,5-epimerase
MDVEMKIRDTGVEGIYVVESAPSVDHRGAFYRVFCDEELCNVLNGRRILQINHSRTEAIGAIRGLHYQRPPYAEMKLVRCLKGKVWDVAVDIRKNSTSFLQWWAEVLTPTNSRMMIIPEGCAHGFQVLEPGSELLYMHTALFSKNSEGGIRYNDPMINIPWPLPVGDISKRDLNHALLKKHFSGIEL